MGGNGIHGPVSARHPSPATALPGRGRTPVPFFEPLLTPMRLAFRDPGDLVPAGDPLSSGSAHAWHAGSLWRSLSVQAHPGGPRTAVDAAEFAAFLEHPDRTSLLAPLLRHTPLVASRPLPYRPGRPSFELDRGRPLEAGHRVVTEERDRSEARLRDFLRADILTTGDRVYHRVQPAVVVGETLSFALLPDPAMAWGFALPVDAHEEACLALGLKAPTRSQKAHAARLVGFGCDEHALLVASVNLFGRTVRQFLDGLARDRINDAAHRRRIRDRIGADGDAWQARAMIGGIDADEGEALLRAAAGAREDILALRPERETARAGFGGLAGRAERLLLPTLRRGDAPTKAELDALAGL